ncbi:MAG: 30S ribosomal protein S18 [Patescibacteria group bacterium]|nr:30S ribosomal protein S18 [Patescibacteria group bacterium]
MLRQKPAPVAKDRYCHFCAHNMPAVDFKDIQLLRRYTSSYGKIVPRRKSGVCTKHQRKLATAIKRARILALLPFTTR